MINIYFNVFKNYLQFFIQKYSIIWIIHYSPTPGPPKTKIKTAAFAEIAENAAIAEAARYAQLDLSTASTARAAYAVTAPSALPASSVQIDSLHPQ